MHKPILGGMLTGQDLPMRLIIPKAKATPPHASSANSDSPSPWHPSSRSCVTATARATAEVLHHAASASQPPSADGSCPSHHASSPCACFVSSRTPARRGSRSLRPCRSCLQLFLPMPRLGGIIIVATEPESARRAGSWVSAGPGAVARAAYQCPLPS